MAQHHFQVNVQIHRRYFTIRCGFLDPIESCPPIKFQIQVKTEQRLSTLSRIQERCTIIPRKSRTLEYFNYLAGIVHAY